MCALDLWSPAATDAFVGQQYWSRQPSAGTRTVEVDKKAYLDIFDSQFG